MSKFIKFFKYIKKKFLIFLEKKKNLIQMIIILYGEVQGPIYFSAFNEKTKIFQEKIYEHALNNEWMSDPYIGFRLKELEKDRQ